MSESSEYISEPQAPSRMSTAVLTWSRPQTARRSSPTITRIRWLVTMLCVPRSAKSSSTAPLPVASPCASLFGGSHRLMRTVLPLTTIFFVFFKAWKAAADFNTHLR